MSSFFSVRFFSVNEKQQLDIMMHAEGKSFQDKITKKMQQLEPAIELIEDPWNRVDHAGNPGGGHFGHLAITIPIHPQV